MSFTSSSSISSSSGASAANNKSVITSLLLFLFHLFSANVFPPLVISLFLGSCPMHFFASCYFHCCPCLLISLLPKDDFPRMSTIKPFCQPQTRRGEPSLSFFLALVKGWCRFFRERPDRKLEQTFRHPRDVMVTTRVIELSGGRDMVSDPERPFPQIGRKWRCFWTNVQVFSVCSATEADKE